MKADNVLQTIGNTPHVRINRLFGPGHAVWIKSERANPGGSIKDRIALSMVEAAEKSAVLLENDGTLPLDRIPAASFDDRHVVGGLAGTSITCPAIDDRLLTLYFDYFVGAGFLPPPPVRTPAPALGSAP